MDDAKNDEEELERFVHIAVVILSRGFPVAEVINREGATVCPHEYLNDDMVDSVMFANSEQSAEDKTDDKDCTRVRTIMEQLRAPAGIKSIFYGRGVDDKRFLKIM